MFKRGVVKRRSQLLLAYAANIGHFVLRTFVPFCVKGEIASFQAKRLMYILRKYILFVYYNVVGTTNTHGLPMLQIVHCLLTWRFALKIIEFILYVEHNGI